jgi:hypothetical protein
MTPEEDKALVKSLPGGTVATRAEVGAVLRTWARENPPKRFALYEHYRDKYGPNGEIIAWGLDFDDHILAQSATENTHAQFESTASLLTFFGAGDNADIELVWVDTPPRHL